jgi:hypothetical protein
MTSSEHQQRAEQLLEGVEEHLAKRGRKLGEQQSHELALAQVHATLALVKTGA